MKRTEIKRRKLADTVLATLEPEAIDYRELDGDGLYFRVKSNGKKSWQLRYKAADKRWLWHTLGSYPEVGGADARLLAADERKLIGQGIFPADRKASKLAAAEIAKTNTFRAVAERWFEFKKTRGLADSTLEKIRTYLDKDILPAIGDKQLDDITRTDCAALQESLEERDAHNVAKKVRSWINQIFGWAIGKGLTENDPGSRLTDIAAQAPETRQYPHLLEPELPAFLQSLRASTSRTPVKTATWLCLWTASRPGMVREAEWSEIDFDDALWSIPETKMKTGRAHVVPLSRQALEMLRNLYRMTGQGRYLFPGSGAKNPCISENTINKAIAAIGYKGRLVGHGTRHTASTLLNEHDWNKDHVERQLAHVTGGVKGIYDKAKYLTQRRVMMQWYCDYLETLEAGMTPAQQADFDRHVNVMESKVLELVRA